MPSYSAFGARLDCPFELPELIAGTSSSSLPSWTIGVERAAPPAIDGVLLGADTVYASVLVRAFAAPGLFRLAFDDTGTFDVRSADRTIVWYPGARSDADAMRADLLGRVMALAAHADGGLALHASAVAIDDRAVAFLGPKHAGKSTTAMALVRAGARLLTDDTLVIRFSDAGRAWATAGVRRVRLWDDAARAMGVERHAGDTAKPTLDPLPDDRLQSADVPLAACYLVRPGSGEAAGVVVRERLSPVRAALACVSFSKLGILTGGAEGPELLGRASRLSRTTGVYEAAVCRDLGRLDALADAIIGWHRSDHPAAMAEQ